MLGDERGAFVGAGAIEAGSGAQEARGQGVARLLAAGQEKLGGAIGSQGAAQGELFERGFAMQIEGAAEGVALGARAKGEDQAGAVEPPSKQGGAGGGVEFAFEGFKMGFFEQGAHQKGPSAIGGFGERLAPAKGAKIAQGVAMAHAGQAGRFVGGGVGAEREEIGGGHGVALRRLRIDFSLRAAGSQALAPAWR